MTDSITALYQRQRDRLRSGKAFTGVRKFPGRQHPWTVWYRGWVIGFRETEDEAVILLARAGRFA